MKKSRKGHEKLSEKSVKRPWKKHAKSGLCKKLQKEWFSDFVTIFSHKCSRSMWLLLILRCGFLFQLYKFFEAFSWSFGSFTLTAALNSSFGPTGNERVNEPMNQWNLTTHLPKVLCLRPSVFYEFYVKPSSRYSFVHIFCWPHLPKVLRDRRFFLTFFMWNRALTKVSYTFCRLHLPKVLRTVQLF